MKSLGILALAFAAALPAQNTRGYISGTINDASGAFVRGVQVDIDNLGTGARSSTATNEEGVYRFAALEPGSYRVRYSKDGFQRIEVERVDVVTAHEAVLNQSIQLASVADTISVVSAPAGIELNKTTPTIEQVLPKEFVDSIPLGDEVGASVSSLVLLAPNVTRNARANQPPASVNGSRALSVNFTIDGTDNNIDFLAIPAVYRVREATSAVQTQSSAYSAEFGRGLGQVSIISRSGDNRFHGQVYHYYKGNGMQALPLSEKRAGLTTVRMVENTFGGAFGGPVRKNKTFFFLQGNGTAQRIGPSAQSAASTTLPTADGYAALANVPLGDGQTVQSRQAVLQAIAFLPEVYREIRRFDSIRTVTVNGARIEVGLARIPFANAIDSGGFSFRVDHRFSDRDVVTVRGDNSKFYDPNNRNYAFNNQFGARYSTAFDFAGRNYALSYVRTLSPRAVNEFRITDTANHLDFSNKVEDTSITVSGLFTLGPHPLTPQRSDTATLQFQDTLTFHVSRHAVKIGADVRRLRLGEVRANNSRGAWAFNNFQDFLNNRANSLNLFTGDPRYDGHFTSQYYFAQDDFKVSRNLTLNIGLRYEYTGSPFGFFGAATSEIAAVGVPLPARPDRNNFAPRGGFAYSPASNGGWKRRLLGNGQTILSVLVLVGALLFTIAVRRDDGPADRALAATMDAAVEGTARGRGAEATVLPNKVAVLPCENQSPNPADAYFASGLHQDIIWQLDKVSNLNPIPRLAVLRYAGTMLSISEIATELRARALLDCTVRYADNRVRITAELVDSTGLTTLWQDDYEPSLADIADVFAVQADIAMSIANALSVVFEPGERELLEKPPTVSTEAYLLFLRAYEEQNYAASLSLYEQSVAADPEFAAPRAALSFLWATELINTNYAAAIAPEARAAHQAKVRDYAERALAIDPKIPFARSALTLTAMLNWQWGEAYERVVRARELTPNDVTQFDIFLLSYLGRHDEALDVVARGEQLYPNDPDNHMWRGWAAGFAGRHDEAAAAFSSIIAEASGEQSLLARDWLARVEIARGNGAAALEQLRLSENITAARPQPIFLPMWAYCYGRLGRTDDARRIVAEMEQREAAGARFGAGGWAMAYLAVGDRTRALEWLETAADKAAANELDEGFFNLMALRANVTNDDALRQPELAEALGRIRGE